MDIVNSVLYSSEYLSRAADWSCLTSSVIVSSSVFSVIFLFQGALTHGDRRAAESRDLSRFNFDTKVAIFLQLALFLLSFL